MVYSILSSPCERILDMPLLYLDSRLPLASIIDCLKLTFLFHSHSMIFAFTVRARSNSGKPKVSSQEHHQVNFS
jgi:hypothetical protein